MPGSWELAAQRPNVLVATLTRELVSTKWANNYRQMQLPPNSSASFISGMPFGHARDQAVSNALQHGYQWLAFLDDDVCVPPDVWHRLLSHGRDIVSGLYYRRALPLAPVMLKNDAQGNPQWITDWNPKGALIEVDLVGAGCLLVHRRVYEALKPPWFIWELEENVTKWIRQGMGEPVEDKLLSEDFSFCRRAQRAGFPIMVDTSIQCEHIGLASSSGAGYQPAGI